MIVELSSKLRDAGGAWQLASRCLLSARAQPTLRFRAQFRATFLAGISKSKNGNRPLSLETLTPRSVSVISPSSKATKGKSFVSLLSCLRLTIGRTAMHGGKGRLKAWRGGNVDILITDFPCVDLSNLNSERGTRSKWFERATHEVFMDIKLQSTAANGREGAGTGGTRGHQGGFGGTSERTEEERQRTAWHNWEAGSAMRIHWFVRASLRGLTQPTYAPYKQKSS